MLMILYGLICDEKLFLFYFNLKKIKKNDKRKN